jgi:circadian clock protein KaiC
VTHKRISSFQPSVVVVDPVTNLIMVSTPNEVRSMLTRLVDFLKTQGITSIFTSLTAGGGPLEASEVDVSSLMDTWLVLVSIEVGGERNRALYVLKSRGMEHSNQIREFLLTDHGLRLLDVYLGPEGVLTGSARLSQEEREKTADMSRRQELVSRQRELERARRTFEARMATLRAEHEAEEERIQQTISEAESLGKERMQARGQMVRSRKADSSTYKKEGGAKAAHKR